MSEPVSIEEQIAEVESWLHCGYVYTATERAILATLRAHQKALAVVREHKQEMIKFEGSTGFWFDTLEQLRRLHRAVTGEEE